MSNGQTIYVSLNSLSHKQRQYLMDLKRNPDGYYGSCTNATMNALRRRGFVDLEWSDDPAILYRREKWVITAAGIEALEPRP